jgi:uncharacterized cysteine cluster protein YcgN (CxxCxxCC family)
MADLCDSVTDNFRVINPKEFRVMNANRSEQVSDCVRLTPANIAALNWLPPTCGYRLVAEGRGRPASGRSLQAADRPTGMRRGRWTKSRSGEAHSVDPYRARDVLELLLAGILKGDIEPALRVFLHPP